jgi:hypothetical protein
MLKCNTSVCLSLAHRLSHCYFNSGDTSFSCGDKLNEDKLVDAYIRHGQDDECNEQKLLCDLKGRAHKRDLDVDGNMLLI